MLHTNTADIRHNSFPLTEMTFVMLSDRHFPPADYRRIQVIKQPIHVEYEMDVGRVGACTKLENKRRKFLIVINDVEKNRYEVYADYLDHAHIEAEINFEKSKMFVRRALVRQKVLQKCMKMRRRTLTTRPEYGRYGGRPIEAFGRDIEGYIAHNHPKLRRKRQLEKLVGESLENGAILKPATMETKVANWMERSYTKNKLVKSKREKTNLETISEKGDKLASKRQQRIPKLPVLNTPFYSASKPEVENTADDGKVDILTEVLENVDLNENKDKKDNSGLVQETLSERRTLILPPIKPSRRMVTTKT